MAANSAPAAPQFNSVQLKVLADNDFAIFMGDDQGITSLFYQNEVDWYTQVDNIQLLDLFPKSGETYVYIVPMGGNGTFYPDGGSMGGAEDWSGVLNGIPLLDYPGGEVAVGRSTVDNRDLFHSGHMIINKYLTNFSTSGGAIADGKYSVLTAEAVAATKNLLWSPATRELHPAIPAPIFGCPVSCSGTRFTPSIPDGAWDIPDGAAALFRYPLSGAKLPVSPGDRQITVTWKDPTDAVLVDNYLIEYKESTQSDATYKTFGAMLAGTVRTSTVTGLTNGTGYTIRVTAINAVGSASSLGRSVVPTGTPSQPANQSYAAGDGSVSINFTPPENDGGLAVTNYAYSIGTGDADGTIWITRSPASTASPITIPGLTNGTAYSVKLRAINPFGAGTPSLKIAVRPGIIATRTLTYAAGTLAAVQGLPSGATYIQGDQFVAAAGPTRSGFTFAGWKDGAVAYLPGATFTVGASNPTLTAQWTQNSFLGTTAADRSRVLTWNIVADEGIDTTVAGGSGNSVRIQIPANALAAGTEVIFWRLLSDNVAKAKINNANSYFVNLAVTWSIGDDILTPKTVQLASSPIVLTVTNPSIMAGATAWQIIGDTVRVIGQAQQNGVLALSFTEDPVITAANVSAPPIFGTPVSTADGFQVAITNYDSTYVWEAPTSSAGTVAITSTNGSVRTLTVSGLGVDASATITQRNSLNGVYQTESRTGRSIAPAPAPVSVPTYEPETTVTPAPTPIPTPTPSPTPKPVALSAKSFNVIGFNPGSWALTKSIKKALDDLFKSASNPPKVSCVGYTMGPTVLKVDNKLAIRRGQEVCRYISATNPSLAQVSTTGTTTRISSDAYRRTRITLTY